MIDLKAKPFNLTEEQVAWVNDTFSSMNDDEKIEQLFCPLLYSNDPGYLAMMMGRFKFGGLMFRPGAAEEIATAINTVKAASKVPLLLSANLEDGGSGIANEGTYVGRQMLIGATGKSERAYELGSVCGKEGMAVGINWSFSPIVDIDMNWSNPITNVRTYGDDVDKVSDMASAYVKGMEEAAMIPTIKHFPGDGVDGRDQHLVTSVNSLGIDEWENSFGKVYRRLIAEGAPTIMVGHIAMPAMEEFVDGKPCEKVIPASVSKNVLEGYLRKEMGFNGLLITDASPMVGLAAVTERHLAVPRAIENGCDMFLFTRDLEEDIKFMKEGYANGILSEERLNAAVTRILALKASKVIPVLDQAGTGDMSVLSCDEHMAIAAAVADEGITLVKDTQDMLPLSPAKHKKVLLQIIGDFASNERVYSHFEKKFIEEGFDVTKYVPETMETIFLNADVASFKSIYDAVIYIGNIENASNKTVARINWHTLFGAGNNLPWFATEVPTMFISVGNPYHLYDVPMIKTFVNAYCHAPSVIDAVIDKVMGRSDFKGASPMDPFCGQWDTRF